MTEDAEIIDEVCEMRLTAIRLVSRLRGMRTGYAWTPPDEADLHKIEAACNEIIKRKLWSDFYKAQNEIIVDRMLEPEDEEQGTGTVS